MLWPLIRGSSTTIEGSILATTVSRICLSSLSRKHCDSVSLPVFVTLQPHTVLALDLWSPRVPLCSAPTPSHAFPKPCLSVLPFKTKVTTVGRRQSGSGFKLKHLFSQRMQVQFPAPTEWLTSIYNSSSRRSLRSLLNPGGTRHSVVHIHTCKQSIHTHKVF